MKPKDPGKAARKYKIDGRVQGVGFRAFVRHAAHQLGVRGWTRNLDDGSVEIYAIGTPRQLAEFSGLVRNGPRFAEVRNVEELEAALEHWSDFLIR
ncbi:MAG TPA: acylphosphatase [Bryobacteraceae bacterium]|nr:acylphosphatase [Bryobacteraceae bacterium]